MSILNNISKKMGEAAKTVGDAAKTATKKTEDLLEISKLNKSISTAQDKITSICTGLGKIVYEKFRNGEEVDEQLADGCRQIVELENEIASIKEKIEDIKKKDKDSAQPVPAEGDEQPPAQQPKKFCPSCGAKLLEGSKFCPSCGEKVN